MNEFALSRALYRAAVFAVVILALVLLGLQLKWVLLQLFAAAIIAAGMAPVVSLFSDPRRRRPWRWRAPAAVVVLVIYLVVGLVVLVLGSILLQAVLAQSAALLARVPEYAAEVEAWYTDLAQRSPVLEQLDLMDAFGGASGLGQWAASALRQVLSVAGLVLGLFGGAINVIFVLFMALYLTVDGPAMRDYLLVFLPTGRQAQARRVITNISFRLGHWVVGQLVLSLIIGVGAGIGLGLIGVPGASLLALVWALSEFIPGIGPFISAVPSILLGFLAGPTTGILATVYTLAWSQVESNVITPRVMGRAVELNPLIVLVALLVGNELLGLAGALFAIPAAAALAVIVDELRQERVAHLRAVAELEAAVRSSPYPTEPPRTMV